MVVHNSFIFSLAFVMIFSVFHFHILMNFVLCFAGVVEDRFRLLQCRNFEVCKILQPAKSRAVAKFLLRAMFIFLPLRLLQPFVSYEIH